MGGEERRGKREERAGEGHGRRRGMRKEAKGKTRRDKLQLLYHQKRSTVSPPAHERNTARVEHADSGEGSDARASFNPHPSLPLLPPPNSFPECRGRQQPAELANGVLRWRVVRCGAWAGTRGQRRFASGASGSWVERGAWAQTERAAGFVSRCTTNEGRKGEGKRAE
jgi:hypothetical protein